MSPNVILGADVLLIGLLVGLTISFAGKREYLLVVVYSVLASFYALITASQAGRVLGWWP